MTALSLEQEVKKRDKINKNILTMDFILYEKQVSITLFDSVPLQPP